MRKTLLSKLIQKLLFLFAILVCVGCTSRETDKSRSVVLIFQDAPSQSISKVIGQNISQIVFEQVCAIDTTGELIQYNPRTIGNDTLVLPSFAGYCEVMLQYQGFERDYYLLKSGDTVLVSYDNKYRPYLTSKTSDAYTRLYNLPFMDSRAVNENGYTTAAILSSDIFKAWHRYYTDPVSQKRFPELKEQFDPVHVNLDSLELVYAEYLKDFRDVLDSLSSVGETMYAEYYRRTILGDGDYTIEQVVQNDSLIHYIGNYRKALEYPQGKKSPEMFDFMLVDTIATPMARRMILKDLINRIKNSDYWTRYPDSLIEKYEMKYIAETGDSTIGYEVVSTPNAADKGGYTYDLVLEDECGGRVTLEELVQSGRGNAIFIDFWASWCAPCKSEMPMAREIRKTFFGHKVSFVYVSTDSDATAWKRAIKDCDTESYGGKNYRLLNGEESLFMKQIKSRYIPQYVMISKEGAVLDIDVPRPSSGKLESSIKEAL